MQGVRSARSAAAAPRQPMGPDGTDESAVLEVILSSLAALGAAADASSPFMDSGLDSLGEAQGNLLRLCPLQWMHLSRALVLQRVGTLD